jgi:hypothetical protein
MTSDDQFTALGPAEIGFQTSRTEITAGVDVEGNGVGVKGKSKIGHGIWGKSGDDNVPNQNAGVFGQHLGHGFGVKGETNGFIPANSPRFASQLRAGVLGICEGLGHGVFGRTDTSLNDKDNPEKLITAGIYGKNHGSGYGTMGESAFGDGVFGTTFNPEKAGVHARTIGKNNEAAGVLGENEGNGAGVFGTANLGNGIYGKSTGGYGGEFSGVLAQVRLEPRKEKPQHDTRSHEAGELFVYQERDDVEAVLYICVVKGNPGVWKTINLT